MKNSFFFGAALLALASCGQAEKPVYNVKVSVPEEMNEKIAYLVNFDNDETLDSVAVAGGVAEFNGEVATPLIAAVKVDGRRVGMFILEADSISVGREGVKGGELNARLAKMGEDQRALQDQFMALPDSLKAEKYPELAAAYEAISDTVVAQNGDNALGLYVYVQGVSQKALADIDADLAKYPFFATSKRVADARQKIVNREETSEGKMFKDFEVTYNDKTFKLSDYVGKGKYVLVDFWASWCGPCRGEIPNLKKIYKDFSPKGLEVIGIAVWDEPEATEKAIEELEIPYMDVLNAQSIPTDLYGIPGIPCIILFGPDGTIVSRDARGEGLYNVVKDAMSK